MATNWQNHLEWSLRGSRNNDQKLIIPYIKLGTIAYAKLLNGSIHMAKCVRMEEDRFLKNYSRPHYFWKVAGLPGEFKNWSSNSLYNDNKCRIANLYWTEKDAQFGDALKCEDKLFTNGFSCWDDMIKKYNLTKENYSTCYEHIRSINLYQISSNGVVYQVYADFGFTLNENGLELHISDLDNGTCFLTREDAMASYQYKPVIDFDDEEETTEQQEEFVELSVKVKKSDVKRVKEFINDCIEFE